jgi:hypothetical protein
MLLLTTAALPQLERHRHPNLGRLITPRHYARLGDTLAAGISVAVDNDCFQGLDPVAVCRMLGAVMPWPSVGARIRRAWPMLAVGSEAVLEYEELPRPHPRLLWRGWLRAGVFEGGIVSAIEAGTPQGSPMTAPTQVRTSSSSGRFRGR